MLLTIMVGLAGPVANAQTSAPNLILTQHPQLAFNVWPGDFNQDGQTDLVAGTAGVSFSPGQPADLLLALGRGDGTFLPPRSLGWAAVPLSVADFDEDGHADILIKRGDAIEVSRGRGDATFDAPRFVGPTTMFGDEVRLWAHAIDLDGDGHRDILVTEPTDTLRLYRGNGDATFRPAIELHTRGGGYQPADATSGDFNNDGRRDFAVVSPAEIDIFLNTGGSTFSRSTIDVWPLTDIVTRDMNNDGRLD
jgi:hypothetical protein